MKNANLTAKETHLLHYIVDNPSTFNDDCVDFSEPFDAQSWEAGDEWYGYPEIEAYVAKHGKAMGVDVNAAKGVLGSLVKKGYLLTGEDGFIVITRRQFNMIYKALVNPLA